MSLAESNVELFCHGKCLRLSNFPAYNLKFLKTENYIQEPVVSERQEPFISSDKFAGKKEGYVFKMDSEGLGYYLDRYQ